MKIVSWNIAGCLDKITQPDGDLVKLISEYSPDVICLQELHADEVKVSMALSRISHLLGMFGYIANCSGNYSGTMTITRVVPDFSAKMPNFTNHKLDVGRGVINRINNTFLINVYVPNSGAGLVRKDFKIEWMKKFTDFLTKVTKTTDCDLIVVGDLNVAISSIELARPVSNWNKTPGYTDFEIECYNSMVSEVGLHDTLRMLHPIQPGMYTFWSKRCKTNRERNVGWRLDYALVTNKDKVVNHLILKEYGQSDHCPIMLEYNI